MFWQFAEAECVTLLQEIRRARQAEELKRVAEIEAEFNGKTLFSGGAR